MSTEQAPARGAPRERWLADAIIAGFVATGASLAALVIAFVLANGAGDSQSDIFRYWLWQLTHNQVVSFSRSTPAIAIIVHVVVGVIWALVYARFAEPRLRDWAPRWSGWQRGMAFA